VPSLTEVTYHGSYVKLDGIRMSEALQSTLRISFDVRGGLLIRQIHHWAPTCSWQSLMVHMLRVFFNRCLPQAARGHWLIGITLFALALIEALFGYSLPDDQLSGAGCGSSRAPCKASDRRHLPGVLPFRRAVPGHDIVRGVHHPRAADPWHPARLMARHIFIPCSGRSTPDAAKGTPSGT